LVAVLSRAVIALQRALAEEHGQGLTEYALILALIAIIAIAALTLLGGNITSALSTVANSL
jgi:pilus assembly protein Flp/PilA